MDRLNMYEILKDRLATCSLLESLTPEGWIIYDVRDLIDGNGNDIKKIKEKIITLSNLLSIGHKVCVRCIAGMSRSNTIACAAMLMINQNHDWEYHWEFVKEKCPRTFVNLDFTDEVKQALLEIGINRKLLYYE
jgi:protein-tyrosine phosphatase